MQITLKQLRQFLWMLVAAAALLLCGVAGGQQLNFAGLLTANRQGQFRAVKSDAGGNLYLLLDEKDGVRVLKTDAGATTVLATQHLGAASDSGVALALDPAGNVYVTGTTSSGALNATPGAAFTAVGNGGTSFIARLDANLNVVFVSFTGGGQIAADAIAATTDAVFITGNIFAATLPVTASAIQQSPANGTSQNGFVERFSADGSALVYATYLTGENGTTVPAAIAADAADNAYIVGYTSASGYPTLNSVVAEMLGTEAGFLTRLTPAGDGMVFSTFISGSGINALALDASQTNLLMTGGIAPGAFPVTGVSAPLVNTKYEALVKMPVDGSAVTSALLLAPGTQSTLAAEASGDVWVAGLLTGALLPMISATQEMGGSFGVRVNTQGVMDRALRFGGLPTANFSYSAAPVNLLGVATNDSGKVTFAGGFAPVTDSSFVASERYDLPLLSTGVLPDAVRDAVPASCSGQCAGAAGFVAGVSENVTGAAFALSQDALPNLTLRNLSAVAASGVAISLSGYTQTNNCGSNMNAGGECSIALSGAGPGSISVQAANAATFTAALPANSGNIATDAVVFSPKELDFGVQTAQSAMATRALTVTNLSAQPQSFTTAADQTGSSGFSVSNTDCAYAGTAMLLAAGASCHISFGFTAAGGAGDGFQQSQWKVAGRDVLLTGYSHAAALSASSSTIEFGTQIQGAPQTARYLYLSNNSDAGIAHASAALPPDAAFTVTDNCPAMLEPRTVCQMVLNYAPAKLPSSDASVLALDDGLSVLVTGTALPAASAGGAAANPNLAVSPLAVSFSNPVIVTAVTGTTQQITVSNIGSAAFALTLGISGDFTETNNCPAILAGGASCAVFAGFAPSQSGTRDGLLTVMAGSAAPIYVTLSGVGNAILPIADGLLNFGDVPLGEPETLWFKVAPLTMLNAGATAPFGVAIVQDTGSGHGQPPTSDFQQTASGSCADCWLGVMFMPASAGAQAGTLTATTPGGGNEFKVALAGNGVSLASALLTPLNQDFGPVTVGSTSGVFTFTLTNGTGAAISIAIAVASGPFAIATTQCGSMLAAGSSCELQLSFAPAAMGEQTGTLSLTTGSGVVQAALSGYGLADPGVSFTPDALLFANASPQTITVMNTGAETISIGALSHATAAFASATNCGTLSAGASCSITVSFTPGSALSGDVLQVPVTGSVGAAPQTTTYSVPLSSSYTAVEAGLAVSPAEMDFGPQATLTAGATRSFRVSNLSAKALTISMNLPRDFVQTASTCGTLAAGASCSFSMQFAPASNGSVTGTVLLTGDPGDGTGTSLGLAYLTGYGVGSASLGLSGSTLLAGPMLNLGNVLSGAQAQQTITLTNHGGSALNIRRLTSEWPFRTATTCNAALAPGATCTATVSYAPVNQVTSGTEGLARSDAGTLVIESDSATGPEMVQLSGSALPVNASVPANAAPLLAYTLSSSSLQFVATAVGRVSQEQQIMLSNTGTAALHVLGVTTTVDYSESDNCGSVIAPGGGCTLSVSLAPQSAGSHLSTLEIASDASTALEFVSLGGTASAGALSFYPASLSFGAVNVGATATQSVQVTNAGATAVNIQSVTTALPFAVSDDCMANGGVLAPAAVCTLQVSFAPATTGAAVSSVNVANSAGTTPLSVAESGSGVQSQLKASAGTLNFGTIALGSGANLTLTLSNNGSATVSGISYAVTGDFAITRPCAAAALNAGAGCTMQLTFTPTAPGASSGILTIASSDPNSPIVVALSGNGIAGGGFTLSAATSAATVKGGKPAVYALTLTPVNGFTGAVALGCAPLNNALYASCSLTAPQIVLGSSGATGFTVTINTITETSRLLGGGGAVMCVLLPFWMRRRKALLAMCCGVLVALSGCGGGVSPNICVTPTGSYAFQVTATGVNGVSSPQSVNLSLTVQ